MAPPTELRQNFASEPGSIETPPMHGHLYEWE